MPDQFQIDKSILEQIIEKMIEKLKDSENFSDEMLEELKSTNFNSKDEVMEIISRTREDKTNEDTETGN